MIIPVEAELSVIIPIHNMAGRLQNLEDSIAAAKGLAVKFLLIDDLSLDSTLDDLESILKGNKDLRIEIISGRFGSPGVARNAGLQRVTSSYVMFADSDDKFYISEIMTALSSISAQTQVIIGSYREINYISGNERLNKPVEPLHVNLALSPGLWRMVFRTAEVKNIEFTDFRMGEDQLWLAEIAILSKSIETSDLIFYDYFSHNPKSLTANMNAKQDLTKIVNEFARLMQPNSEKRSKLLFTVFTKIWMTALLNSQSARSSAGLILTYVGQALRNPQLIWYLCVILSANVSKRRDNHANQ